LNPELKEIMISEEFAAIREEEQKSSDTTKEIKQLMKKIRRDYTKGCYESWRMGSN